MTEKRGTQLRKTAKHTAIYAIGTIVRRITGLVMLPIYTRYLTPADYGVVELLSMAIEITGILVGLRISQAMFRYYILADNELEKRLIVSTVLFTVLGASAVGAAVLYVAADPLARLIFGTTDYAYELQLFALTLVTNAIAAVGLSYLRARQKPVLFVSIGIASLVLQVTLNVIFVVKLEMHVTGVVYSAVLSGLVLATGLSVYVLSSVGFHYSKAVVFRLFKFVAPLIAASVGAFYVAYADKYFLRVFGSLTDVGLYAVAARVSSVLMTVFEAFNMSWAADRFEILKKENAKQIYEQVFRFLSAGLILMGAGLTLFAADFFRVMTNPVFYSAAYVVPTLILAGLVSVYTIFCNFGILYRERTGYIAEASWGKAVVASVGYFSLIPALGVQGAAITVAVSNVVEFAWLYRHSTRLYDMGLKWRPVFHMFSAAGVCVVVGLLLPQGEAGAFATRVVLFCGLLLVIYTMPVWTADERQMISDAVMRIVRLRSGG